MKKPTPHEAIKTATTKLKSRIPTAQKSPKIAPKKEYNIERFRDNYHAISDKEPLSSGTVELIVESMKMYGFDKKKPIMIYEGKIADGRHRFIIAHLLKLNHIPVIINRVHSDYWSRNKAVLLSGKF